jgi:hypothetical protein
MFYKRKCKRLNRAKPMRSKNNKHLTLTLYIALGALLIAGIFLGPRSYFSGGIITLNNGIGEAEVLQQNLSIISIDNLKYYAATDHAYLMYNVLGQGSSIAQLNMQNLNLPSELTMNNAERGSIHFSPTTPQLAILSYFDTNLQSATYMQYVDVSTGNPATYPETIQDEWATGTTAFVSSVLIGNNIHTIYHKSSDATLNMNTENYSNKSNFRNFEDIVDDDVSLSIDLENPAIASDGNSLFIVYKKLGANPMLVKVNPSTGTKVGTPIQLLVSDNTGAFNIQLQNDKGWICLLNNQELSIFPFTPSSMAIGNRVMVIDTNPEMTSCTYQPNYDQLYVYYTAVDSNITEVIYKGSTMAKLATNPNINGSMPGAKDYVLSTAAGSKNVIIYKTVGTQTLAAMAINTSQITPPNSSPVASTQGSMGGIVNFQLTLDGTGSSDPDPADTLTYLWRTVSVPDGSKVNSGTIVGAGTASAGFTPDIEGQYRFTLEVSDGNLQNTANLIVNAMATNPLSAGPDQNNVMQNNTVNLSGSINPAPAGWENLTYLWTFQSKPSTSTATISNGSSLTSASFIADKPGTYILTLTASDNFGSITDQVSITNVTNTDDTPTATTAAAQTTQASTTRAPSFSTQAPTGTPAVTPPTISPFIPSSTPNNSANETITKQQEQIIDLQQLLIERQQQETGTQTESQTETQPETNQNFKQNSTKQSQSETPPSSQVVNLNTLRAMAKSQLQKQGTTANADQTLHKVVIQVSKPIAVNTFATQKALSNQTREQITQAFQSIEEELHQDLKNLTESLGDQMDETNRIIKTMEALESLEEERPEGVVRSVIDQSIKLAAKKESDQDKSATIQISRGTIISNTSTSDIVLNPPVNIANVAKRDELKQKVHRNVTSAINNAIKKSSTIVHVETGSANPNEPFSNKGKSGYKFSKLVNVKAELDKPILQGTDIVAIALDDATGNVKSVFTNAAITATGEVEFFADSATVYIIVPVEEAVELGYLEPPPTFSDLGGAYSWSEQYVNKLAKLNVVSGKREGEFAPGELITRAELTKIALGTFGYSVDTLQNANGFTDMPSAHWANGVIRRARETNIVGGYADNTFRADVPVTRAEAMKILLKAAQVDIDPQNTQGLTFPDTDTAQWYAPYVAYAAANNIVSGFPDGTFGPGQPITRAAVTKIAMNIRSNKLSQETNKVSYYQTFPKTNQLASLPPAAISTPSKALNPQTESFFKDILSSISNSMANIFQFIQGSLLK